MRILVVGGGGREHAMCWRLARDRHQVLCAPGNPGVAEVAECVAVAVDDLAGLAELARARAIELVVIGPEAPLCAGLADSLRAAGVPTFGPGATGARLEGSKAFAKEFFARAGIRTAPFRVCHDEAEAERALTELGAPVVVKADGLASGKGVVVCDALAEARAAVRAMLTEQRFGAAGATVVIERRISGREVSVMALCDGERFEILAPAEDHKTIYDGDRGPNTGGMGTVSPPAWLDEALMTRIADEIFAPTVRGLRADGIDFRGVLYAGLMIAADGEPFILEYNCRFGDPETQPVLVRAEGDFGQHLYECAQGKLPERPLTWDPRTAVCVVLAAAGYPAAPEVGAEISGLSALSGRDVFAFHAGTALVGGVLSVQGGRVLGVTALGEGVEEARRRAYEVIGTTLHFDGMQYRRDIGARRA